MAPLFQDLRYAMRVLGRGSGFNGTTVRILAPAMGASAAIFSVIEAVLLRPLPYHDPERLCVLWKTVRTEMSYGIGPRTPRSGIGRRNFGYHRRLLRIHVSAIIFDYGNVLCTSPLPEEIQGMAAILDMPIADFQMSYWRDRLAYDRAAVDPAAYWNTVAGRQLSPADVDKLQGIDSASWSHPDPVMAEWAKRVRAAGFRTALLSNMPAPVRDYIIKCPWLPEFDHTTFSCDLRSTKPSSEIYRHSLAGLGVGASDALLLDDRAENIRAAEAMGIHCILFTTPQALPHELERRFAIHVPLIVK